MQHLSASAAPSIATPAQLIDAWWRYGRPSNTLPEAGVLLRQLDYLVDYRHGPVWQPCNGCPHSQIWPASVVNMRHNPAVFAGTAESHDHQDRPGFVLAPSSRFNCIYALDGNSNGVVSEASTQLQSSTLAPGCRPPCLSRSDVHGYYSCSFSPERLAVALEVNEEYRSNASIPAKYNEAVINATAVQAALPRSILAVFYIDAKTHGWAYGVHRAFMAAFNLTAAQFPLLKFDVAGGFREVAVHHHH